MTPPTSTLVAGELLYYGGAAGGGSGPGPPHLGIGNACGQVMHRDSCGRQVGRDHMDVLPATCDNPSL